MKSCKFLLPFLLLGSHLFAQNLPPPEVIQEQLNEAEREFEVAKKMFNPYYSGPLLASSANNVPPGSYLFQPYLFVLDSYGSFDSHRHIKNIPDFVVVNPTAVFETGITDWLDIAILPSLISNHQSGHSSTNIGDTKVVFGIQLGKETLHTPAFRFTISELFPTGKYDHLNPSKGGVDATGAGSFQTQLSFIFQKIVFWMPLHPMRLRFNFSYQIALPTHVHGFNAYGGGYGTRGKVKPGNTYTMDWAVEYSITQKWVFALDWVYYNTRRSNFSGKRGRDEMGLPNSIGTPSSDQMSFAPAIQYNYSENFGILIGSWFSFWGRNSSAFAGGIATVALSW